MCSLFRLLVGLSTLGGLLLIGSILVAAAAPNPPHVITLHEGKLSVHVTGMPLREVLAEVSRLSHTELVWLSSEGQEELVSVEFTGLSLLQGLERILQRRNFLLFYVPQPSGTHVTQLWIASNRQVTKPPPPTTVAEAPPSPPKDKAPKVAQAGSANPANQRATKWISQRALSHTDPHTPLNADIYFGLHAKPDAEVRAVFERLPTEEIL